MNLYKKPTTKEAPKPTPTTTPKPATQAPPTRKPAPIHENVAEDTKRPQQEKLKVIKKGNEL